MTSHLIIKICCICLCIIIFPYSCMAGCPCDNLTEVTSQDDLFRQIYETALNDNCLFSINATKLQSILKIPVIQSGYNSTDYKNNMLYNEYYTRNGLRSRIGVYITIWPLTYVGHMISISPTNEYLYAYKTLFPDGIISSHISYINRIKIPEYMISIRIKEQKTNLYRKNKDFLQDGYFYYWKGERNTQSRMVFVVEDGFINNVTVYEKNVDWLQYLK